MHFPRKELRTRWDGEEMGGGLGGVQAPQLLDKETREGEFLAYLRVR